MLRAGRDKRKKGGRVFSLENVASRLEAVSGKWRKCARVCVRFVCMLFFRMYDCVCVFVCVCTYVCKCTSVVSIHQKLGETVNCKMGERTQSRITIA